MTNASSLSSSTASAWMGGIGNATASASWLSSDWLLSRKAIPLYLLLGLWLVQRLPSLLERFFTPKPTSSTSAWVVPAETRHARFLPAQSQHAFRYNTLYLALRLDKLETRNLDTGHAFSWKGPVLQPEFVDQAAIADRRGVTPAGDGGVGKDQADWKAKMRAAERIERRRLEEKRSRNDRYTWSLTGLHPSAYLRTHIPVSTPTSDDAHSSKSGVSDPSTGEMTSEKATWISGSVLLKLAYELRERGFLSVGPQDSDTNRGDGPLKDWRHELGHVWTVTMPSIAGITGINPLTVHYCYRPHGFGTAQPETTANKGDEEKRGAFWLVVLEVHNTFSERHIYVLEAGKDEDGEKGVDGDAGQRRGGYDHQWTFARSFHVSPFNDRGGYYRLFLKEPFAAAKQGSFVLGIRLLLLVEPQGDTATNADDSPSRLVKKLMATLDSISPSPVKPSATLTPSSSSNLSVGRCVRPLSAATLYAALLRQSFDLFLTFFRILYEAAKLHFSKRLDAFGRPDMVQLGETTQQQQQADEGGGCAYNGEGLPPVQNRIQPHRQQSGSSRSEVSVGLVYPEAGWGEKVAKDYVQWLLSRRVEELRREKGESWTVKVESTDGADSGIEIGGERLEGGKARELVLYTRSYGVYVDLMTYQPARLALLLGSIVGRRWGVSSTSDFDDFFPTQPVCERGIRKRQFEFLLTSHLHSSSSSSQYDRQTTLELLHKYGIPTAPTPGMLKGEKEGWKVNLALWLGYVAAVMEKNAFRWLGARYVKGTEPWLILSRALNYIDTLQDQDQGEKLKEKAPQNVDDASWDTRLGSVHHP